MAGLGPLRLLVVAAVAWAGAGAAAPVAGAVDAVGAGIDGVAVSFDAAVPAKVRTYALLRLKEVFDMVGRDLPTGRGRLARVAKVEIVPSSLFSRFVGWRPDRDRPTLRIAAGSLFDKDPIYLAQAIAREAARREPVGSDSDADADGVGEGLEQVYKGKRLVGSAYPDIKNRSFFRTVRQALDMVEHLPADLRAYVDVIDEIRYNPSSRHFIKAGPVDATVAFYNRLLSQPGRRIVFVRRDMRFSSAIDVARMLVHEGTHVVQDMKAERLRADRDRQTARLAELEAAGQGDGSEARTLRAERDYVRKWYEGGRRKDGLGHVMAFECEATRNEIRMARALDGPVSLIESSQYLDKCPDAKRMMATWHEARSRRSATR